MAGGWKTCHVPRRTWLDGKIDVFLEELAASGMHLDRQRAGELITGQVRAVATLMRVTEATARNYLDDESIKDMARRMLFEVAGERPGADLLEAPRTVPLPLALVGITVAALAEAMQVRAAKGEIGRGKLIRYLTLAPADEAFVRPGTTCWAWRCTLPWLGLSRTRPGARTPLPSRATSAFIGTCHHLESVGPATCPAAPGHLPPRPHGHAGAAPAPHARNVTGSPSQSRHYPASQPS